MAVAGQTRQLAFFCMIFDECLDVYQAPDV
jgi:hypothetical protein